MNQTFISTVVSDLLNDGYPKDFDKAPKGFIWKKSPDQYDPVYDMIWEGSWDLVPEQKEPEPVFEKKIEKKIEKRKFDHCEWNCPNGHMGDHYCYKDKGGYDMWLHGYKAECIKRQRKAISNTLNPEYHICTHGTHEVCSNSVCCDFFWHDGGCSFVSDVDGEKGGYAVRFGDQ